VIVDDVAMSGRRGSNPPQHTALRGAGVLSRFPRVGSFRTLPRSRIKVGPEVAEGDAVVHPGKPAVSDPRELGTGIPHGRDRCTLRDRRRLPDSSNEGKQSLVSVR
jgi:hypothetical protein